MDNINDIYQKKRITAQEVFEYRNEEDKKAIIKGFQVDKRKYKDEEYNFIKLFVEHKGKERTIDLKQHNADEIARVAGENPNNWGGVIIQMQASKEGGEFPKMFLFVSQKQQEARKKDLGISFV